MTPPEASSSPGMRWSDRLLRLCPEKRELLESPTPPRSGAATDTQSVEWSKAGFWCSLARRRSKRILRRLCAEGTSRRGGQIREERSMTKKRAARVSKPPFSFFFPASTAPQFLVCATRCSS